MLRSSLQKSWRLWRITEWVIANDYEGYLTDLFFRYSSQRSIAQSGLFYGQCEPSDVGKVLVDLSRI
jgi:hypothetical protein